MGSAGVEVNSNCASSLKVRAISQSVTGSASTTGEALRIDVQSAATLDARSHPCGHTLMFSCPNACTLLRPNSAPSVCSPPPLVFLIHPPQTRQPVLLRMSDGSAFTGATFPHWPDGARFLLHLVPRNDQVWSSSFSPTPQYSRSSSASSNRSNHIFAAQKNTTKWFIVSL